MYISGLSYENACTIILCHYYRCEGKMMIKGQSIFVLVVWFQETVPPGSDYSMSDNYVPITNHIAEYPHRRGSVSAAWDNGLSPP